MRASAPSLRRIALASVLLVGGCRKSEAAAVEHDPVRLGQEQRDTVARFAGAWQHVGGDEDRTAARAAVSKVTAQMNGLIRGMAQSRLEETVRIDATLRIAEAEGIVTITRSERAQPFTAPADGTEFETVNEEGEPARGSLRIDGPDLVTHIETDQGGGERTYHIDGQGRLEITTRIFSPRLPGDVVYVARYDRP